MAEYSGTRFYIRKESYTGGNIIYMNTFKGPENYTFYATNPLDAIAFQDRSMAEAHAKVIDEDESDLEIVKMDVGMIESMVIDPEKSNVV